VRLALCITAGVLGGVLFSVSSLCLYFGPGALLVALIVAATGVVPARYIPRPADVGVAAVAAGVVVFAAAEAPFKYVDRRIVGPLPSNCVALSTIAESMHMRPSWSYQVGDEALKRTVCLPSTRPTLRQVLVAMDEQANFAVDFRWCGTDATVLWGAHPMGRMQLRTLRP
jgi:hypothetical protein